MAPWIAAHSHPAGYAISGIPEQSLEKLRFDAHLMAERDALGAFIWAERLPETRDRIAALSSILYQIALKHPQTALEISEGVDLGERRGDVQRAIRRQQDVVGAFSDGGDLSLDSP